MGSRDRAQARPARAKSTQPGKAGLRKVGKDPVRGRCCGECPRLSTLGSHDLLDWKATQSLIPCTVFLPIKITVDSEMQWFTAWVIEPHAPGLKAQLHHVPARTWVSLMGPQLLSKAAVKCKCHGDRLPVTGIVNTHNRKCYHYQHHRKIYLLVASSFLAGDPIPGSFTLNFHSLSEFCSMAEWEIAKWCFLCSSYIYQDVKSC